MLNAPSIQYNIAPDTESMEIGVCHDTPFAASVVTAQGHTIPHSIKHAANQHALNKIGLMHGNELVIDLPDGLEIIIRHKGAY
jgi:hypothetical protein